MSLELYSAEVKALDTLWQAWETKSDYELEATFRPIDYTGILNILKQLRNLGYKEYQKIPTLNILLSNGLRFTIEGDELIQQYCKDNTLRGKEFRVMLKEKKVLKSGASEVDIKEYGIRVKLRRELNLPNDDSRVQDALKKWASLPKAFRYIKRYSFVSTYQKGIQFDASFVRENKKDSRGSYIPTTSFNEAQIHKQDVKYEMEIEAIRNENPQQKTFLVGCAVVLRGLQRSYILTRNSIKHDVLRFMATKTETVIQQAHGRLQGFPGAKPVTLRKEHIDIDQDTSLANIRFGDYNVTDKADGLRCLLIVSTVGKIYLIDQGLNVYGTDRYFENADFKECVGIVLDGEWVTQNKDNQPISHYYAFDIFNGINGEDKTHLPFHTQVETSSRHIALSETIALLSRSKSSLLNTKNSLSIFMKTFRFSNPADPISIFKESAAILDRSTQADAPYHTDGLIFTPNKDALPKNGRTWVKQLKWKPASMNSVDFLVVTEKDRSADGKQTNVDSIQYNDFDGKPTRSKTLHLFVGSSIDPLRIDSRNTILQKLPLPSSDRNTGPYRPIEFTVTPSDPVASICHVALPETDDDVMYCAETKDPINDRTIVEMVYKPENPPGWRWVPLRVRWDKTELFARGEVGRTMNDVVVATDVWESIHDPITETMIRTGKMSDESYDGEVKPKMYYKKKSGQDRHMTGGMTSFHNQYIKDRILLSSTIKPGSALLDMSVGRAGDLHKWIAAKVGWVLGCDISLSGLTEKDGAYDRYLTQSIQRKGNLPKMLFVNADSGKRYADGSAGLSSMDSDILRCVWGTCNPDTPPAVKELEGKATEGFDVVASMFALHYFFNDRTTFDAVLQNLHETVKVGGYFVGCCTDGDQVSALLAKHKEGESVSGSEDGKTLWKITKRYDDSQGFLPSDDSGLGRAIDVNFISIGETHTEYLVSFEYLKSRLSEIGLELLTDEELESLKLRHSTNLFGESYEMAKSQGFTYSIPTSLQSFSFLSRWFIFKCRKTEAPVLPQVLPEKEPEESVIEHEGGFNKGQVYQFYHKSKPGDELKVGNKHWRRYISTYAPFTFHDIQTPTIEYSSLEAALGSAKFQYGTNRPELGPQIFSKTGNIHQDIAQREFLSKASLTKEDEEGSNMRAKQKPSEIRKTGAKWNQASWDSKQEEVLEKYLKQRFVSDEQFRKIIHTLNKQNAQLVYYSPGAGDLGGTITEDGSVDGLNLLGRIIMKLA